MPQKTNPHEAKVTEIRDNFKEDFDHWDPIYKDGDINMRFLTEGPWDPNDRKARLDAGRPVVSFDELGQYINQAQNEVRTNPRSPRFSPEDEDASDQTALIYANSFRKAEDKCNAQEAYTTAYDNALSRGYSFVEIKFEFEHSRSFFQHVVIEPVPIPSAIYPDCNSVRVDGADWKRLSKATPYTKAEFNKEFPGAEFTDFSTEQIAKVGSTWMGQNRVQVLEYYEVETIPKVLREYEVPATKRSPVRYVQVLDGEPKPRGGKLVQERESEVKKCFKYFCNGVELLKKGGKVKHEQPTSMIPIAPCYGKMVWVNNGSGPERKLLSMVTLAREPYAAYCFAAACELEAVGTITKNPYWAYEGQLDANLKNRVKMSLHEPVAILEAKATLPGMAAGTILPLPQRNPMAVDLTAYAMVKEGARRAIQAAMNFVPMQTSMQRQNQKLSGAALDRMEDQGLKGAYHFTDHFNDLLRRCGVIYEDGFDKINDVERMISVMEADKTVKKVLIGGWNGKGPKPERPKDLDKDVDYIPSVKGRHSVTVDVGPEMQSERKEASVAVDSLVGSPLFATLDPPKRDKLLALSIRERITSPIGQKMADVIDPKPQGEMPDAQQLMGLLQQAQQQIIPALQQQIAALEQKLAAKVVETQGKMAIDAEANKAKLAIEQAKGEASAAKTAADNATALQIQEMKNAIELLKMQLAGLTKGAEFEANAQAGADVIAHEASEADKGREHESAEGEKTRAVTMREGDESRKAAEKQAAMKPKPGAK